MISITEHDVAELIRKSLASRASGQPFDVQEAKVYQEDDWWYVPLLVRPHVASIHEYYDLLAEVEDDLKEHSGVTVTLLPRIDTMKLVPLNRSLRPMYLGGDDWKTLCDVAGISPLKETYDRNECQRVASAIGANPQVIAFDPPSVSQEVRAFFQNCDGAEQR